MMRFGQRASLLVALFLLTLVVPCTVSVAGDKRYVVAGKQTTEYPLWTDASWPAACAKAVMGGTKNDQQKFCEDGFSGLKPKVGRLPAGTEVELLDSPACGQMTYVRVLIGAFKGEVGCIVAAALSSVKPE